MRNPWRVSFDRGGNHELFAADVGQDAFEEVNIIVKGGNYGWNIKEGLHCFNTEDPKKPLSDSKIMKILNDEGINIARRTVAKYRDELNIPSSTDRKQVF